MTRKNEIIKGHLPALFCVVIWGSTFIASKRLLAYYTPAQLMFMRFAAAYAVLWLLCPRRVKTSPREELSLALMGLTGGFSGFTLVPLFAGAALIVAGVWISA